MKISNSHSKNMHLHTEREGAYFPLNAINEVSQRYFFAKKYCKNKVVLEIGPGTGIASDKLINISKEYVCVEYSKENYQILKKKYPDIQSVNSDFLTVDLLDKKFDTIISMANIYYFDFQKFIAKCSKYNTKNGDLVFCTTNISHQDFNPAPFSIKYYSLSKLREIMNNYGYKTTFYGAFKKVNNTGTSANILNKILKILIPKFIVYQMKILLKKIKPFAIDSHEISTTNKKMQLDLVDSDSDSKDYIVLYCSAKKVRDL